MDEKKFEELVKEFGSTKKRFISKDRTTNECNGFGFVHYSSKSNAEKAIEVLNGKEIDGSVLTVEWSKRDNKTSNKTKIYVSNIRDSVQENDVEELVKEFGPFDRIYLAKDKTTGLGKGYAFVDFKSHEDAAKAVEKLNGFMVGENQLKVDWARIKERRRRKFIRSRRSESGKDDGKKKADDQVDNDLKKMVENITI
jgi:RNA recognition motif-containing protein